MTKKKKEETGMPSVIASNWNNDIILVEDVIDFIAPDLSLANWPQW